MKKKLVAAFAVVAVTLLQVSAAAALPTSYGCWHWYNSGGRHSYGGGVIVPNQQIPGEILGETTTRFSNQSSCVASTNGWKTKAVNHHYHFDNHHGGYQHITTRTVITYTGIARATTSEANGPLGYTNRTLNQHAIWDSGNYHATLPVVLEY